MNTKPVYIKRFGRPLLNQALVVTVLAPLLLLFPDHGSKSMQIMAVVGVSAVFWIVWVIWGRCSVEIDEESFRVKKSGTRTYLWSDRPNFIYHRPPLSVGGYLEIIRKDYVSDTLGDEIADDELLDEIRKYASIEISKDVLPCHRVR